LAVVLVDAQSTVLLALASVAVILTDARPAVLFVTASYLVVLADVQSSTLLSLASYALVLADNKVAEMFAAPYVLHYHLTHHCTQSSVKFRLR
jgi:hypothetical protein